MLTLKELKYRQEAGEKLTKPAKKQIKQQLNRVCKRRGCKESLAFANRRKEYCSTKCATWKPKAHKKPTKAQNRAKKNRYYKKHSIEFKKNIMGRSAAPSKETLKKGTALHYTTQALIYENYKEPLKAIEKNKGYGYYGTIATTDDKAYIQCHICGHLFASLGGHIRLHNVATDRYKEMFELQSSTALISEPLREKRQQAAVKPFNGKLPDHLIEYNRRVREGLIKHNGNKGKNNDKRGSWTLEKRNKEGLCPDQVLEKIRELADSMGKTPSYEEFIEHYKYRFAGSISFQHGSWSNAVKKLGLKTREELRRVDKETLIEELQTFHKEHGRIPMTSDFNRGLLRNRGTFISKFGSLNNARIEAGLNAVLPMPFGQIIELTAEQYMQYQEGHIVPGKVGEDAVKKRAYRIRKRKLTKVGGE